VTISSTRRTGAWALPHSRTRSRLAWPCTASWRSRNAASASRARSMRGTAIPERTSNASRASRRTEAEAHGRSQGQDLYRRPREQVTDRVREGLLAPAIERGRQVEPWTQSHIARRRTTRHHPIPQGLALQGRLARAEGCFERRGGAGHEVHGRQLEPRGRLRLAGATRQ